MRITGDVKRWWMTLEPEQRNLIKGAVLFLLAVFCSAVFVIPWNWQRSEWLSLWQVLVTGLAFVVAVFMIHSAARQFRYGRQRDEEARERSLSLIKHSLKSELQTNRRLLAGEYQIRVESDPATRVSHAIGVRPLKVSAFELVIQREDLKYFKPPESLSTVMEAYDQIKDFNNILEWWFTRAVLGQGRRRFSKMAGRVIDFAQLTWEQLNEEAKKTSEKIDEALKALGSTD